MSQLVRPEYLRGRGPSALASAVASGLGSAQPPRVSLKDDRFTCLTANGERHPQIQPALTLDVIVVGGNPNPSRVFYDGAYDATTSAAPACWSDNGVGPSVDAASPQSTTCDACPNAVWGSKISANSNKIPACSTQKKIAVLAPGGGDMVFLLSIPPASLKPWRNFLAHLDNLGASIDEVIVRVSMTDKTLSFETVDFLPQQVYDMAQKVIASPEPHIVVGAKDRVRQGALPAPAADRPQITARPESREEIAPAASFSAPAASPPETEEQREAREFAEYKRSKAQSAPAVFAPAPSASAGFITPPAEVAPKRTRGPNKPKDEVAVGPGPIPAGTFQAPAASFGVVEPSAPSGGMEDLLAKAFNLPLN